MLHLTGAAGVGILACYENETMCFYVNFGERGDTAKLGSWGHEFFVRGGSRILRSVEWKSRSGERLFGLGGTLFSNFLGGDFFLA